MVTPPHPPNRPPHVRLPYTLPRADEAGTLARAAEFARFAATRRSCRFFSPESVPRELLLSCIQAAHAAPSGANCQPWRFVVVDDAALKGEIRAAAEREEQESYGRRMPPEWLAALHPIGTDWRKPFLEIAPWLVVIFRVDWDESGGRVRKHYYVPESVGLAAGFFLLACHHVGLATLTHTPSPMGFLREILGRPRNERPFLLIPVGWPAPDAVVPDLTKKSLADVVQFNRGGTQGPGVTCGTGRPAACPAPAMRPPA